MRPRPMALLLAAAILTTTAGEAGENKTQFTLGSNFFNISPPCPVNQLPTFESIAPVPAIFDPLEQDLVSFFCDIQVTRNGNGVGNAKGRYTSEVVVRDNNTGQFQSFPVDNGRFKTDSSGRGGFDFKIPTDVFVDGFESGDVSAWSYTRADFSNRKRVGAVS